MKNYQSYRIEVHVFAHVFICTSSNSSFFETIYINIVRIANRRTYRVMKYLNKNRSWSLKTNDPNLFLICRSVIISRTVYVYMIHTIIYYLSSYSTGDGWLWIKYNIILYYYNIVLNVAQIVLWAHFRNFKIFQYILNYFILFIYFKLFLLYWNIFDNSHLQKFLVEI